MIRDALGVDPNPDSNRADRLFGTGSQHTVQGCRGAGEQVRRHVRVRVYYRLDAVLAAVAALGILSGRALCPAVVEWVTVRALDGRCPPVGS
jgi:hypothetical protein